MSQRSQPDRPTDRQRDRRNGPQQVARLVGRGEHVECVRITGRTAGQMPQQVLLKSVRLHALQTNYETRWAIAVHCYLICRRWGQQRARLEIILYGDSAAAAAAVGTNNPGRRRHDTDCDINDCQRKRIQVDYCLMPIIISTIHSPGRTCTGNGRSRHWTLDTGRRPGRWADKWRRQLHCQLPMTVPPTIQAQLLHSPAHALDEALMLCRCLRIHATPGPARPHRPCRPCLLAMSGAAQIACTILNGFWLFMTIRRADWPARCWPLIMRHLNNNTKALAHLSSRPDVPAVPAAHLWLIRAAFPLDVASMQFVNFKPTTFA